ncbi:hypothetical protein GCM10017673_37180 [Streptosporangium violaceochromogenes]|nr:hypothetical protein GCM10017673_37180 [Streptosporangium violaceochromogenes]
MIMAGALAGPAFSEDAEGGLGESGLGAVENYPYRCTGGSLGGEKQIGVAISVPGAVSVGGAINIRWTLTDFSFVSPDELPSGGHLALAGTVGAKGLWDEQGQNADLALTSVTKAGLKPVKAGDAIGVPTSISGSVTAPREGTAEITPGSITVDVAPSEIMVNDNDIHSSHPPFVEYKETPPWEYLSGRNTPSEPPKNHKGDVHRNAAQGAEASLTFWGTGVEFVSEKAPDMGEAEIYLDPRPDSPPVMKVNANVPDGGRQSPVTLWSSGPLKYGKHVVKIRNVADGKYAVLDAFKVLTAPLTGQEVTPGRITCVPLSTKTLKVKVEKTSSTSPTPTGTQTSSTGPSPSPTGTVTSTPKPTLTVTATVTPTRPTPTAPQVVVTPTGGAQTGQAPDDGRPSGTGLIGAGTAMVLGSAFGGVALKRRRAAHARGRAR